MAARLLFSLFFLTLIFKTQLSLPVADPQLNLIRPSNPTADDVHDLLQQYGLPKGLLPNNVKSYSISDDGDLSIEMQSPCYVKFVDLVHYDKVIKGKLRYGGVRDLSGILEKKLFAWLPVTAVELDSDARKILVSVGFLSDRLPAEVFQEVPVCLAKGRRAFQHLLDSIY